MIPTDDKLKRELAGGPLKKSGFDERLRRRIEERLDESPDRRPFRPFRLAGTGMALCVMIAAFVLLIRLHPGNPEEARPAADSSVMDTAAATTTAMEAAEETPRRSVLLLGLRQDGTDGDSAYRTLLVSGGPEPSDWSAAEGEGIIMPHRTDFWRLEVTESQGEGGSIRLAGAYNASRGEAGPPQPVLAGSGSAGSIGERILFAGNRYIAIARQMDGEWTQRMMEITDLALPRSVPAIASGSEREVALASGLNGTLEVAEADRPQESDLGDWTFARKGGLWIASGRELTAGQPAETRGQRQQTLVLGSTIVAHNELALSWTDIREVQPAAVDAVTSPIRNMAAILTDRQIVFYSMKRGALDQEVLEMPLHSGETIIMAEWATHVDYVDEWIRRVGELLGEARDLRQADEQPDSAEIRE